MTVTTTPTRPTVTEATAAARRPRRSRPPLRARDMVRWFWLVALTVVIGFPVYVTLLTGLLPPQDVAHGTLLPTRLTLDNFREALRNVPFGQQYVVSVLVTALQTGGQLLTSSLAAYALVFPRWRGRAVAFAVIVATLAIPGESLVIPNYELVTGLGLRDSLLGITLPFLAAGYPVFLLRQAFLTLPREVWEAARLDGCGDLRCLFLVVLPMARPQVTAATLWSALAAWNGYFWPLLITDSPDRRTVQVGISQLVNAESTSPGVIYAGTTLVLLPTLLLVIVGQRFLLRGLARTSPR
ncbi:carbohydrate ABC transporter permease [Streptomyces violaceusniger]|uniref:Glycerol-3-phosphate ABC transporter permease n=1 Tax=Streptomyces violaceusniger TaxID=68280 RepID=A0A4D4L3Z1_STRVO|nr:glycerol-3-phosphate ABC transporter permease [Streptomyces violaceusniger]